MGLRQKTSTFWELALRVTESARDSRDLSVPPFVKLGYGGLALSEIREGERLAEATQQETRDRHLTHRLFIFCLKTMSRASFSGNLGQTSSMTGAELWSTQMLHAWWQGVWKLWVHCLQEKVVFRTNSQILLTMMIVRNSFFHQDTIHICENLCVCATETGMSWSSTCPHDTGCTWILSRSF